MGRKVGYYALMAVAFAYLGFLCWLAFVNWKAAIFLLLLALATNTGRIKN